MTIYEIKRAVEKKKSRYFTRDIVKYYGQILKDFSVKKHKQNGVNGYIVSAPAYLDGIFVLNSERFFNPITKQLEFLEQKESNNEK